MLVLSRKANERIYIGDDIAITVLEVRRNQVKIGIETPGTTLVLRGELVDGKAARPTPPEAGRPGRAER